MDDDETEESEVLAVMDGRKNNKWFLIAGLNKLAADICASFQDFFEVNYIGATQRFSWENNRQEFFESASLELETLETTEEGNATP